MHCWQCLCYRDSQFLDEQVRIPPPPPTPPSLSRLPLLPSHSLPASSPFLCAPLARALLSLPNFSLLCQTLSDLLDVPTQFQEGSQERTGALEVGHSFVSTPPFFPFVKKGKTDNPCTTFRTTGMTSARSCCKHTRRTEPLQTNSPRGRVAVTPATRHPQSAAVGRAAARRRSGRKPWLAAALAPRCRAPDRG